MGTIVLSKSSQWLFKMSHKIPVSATAPLYARFSRRLRGMFIDWVISVIVAFGALFLAIAIGNDNFSRALGFLIVGAFLLYEPVLVSYAGGTVGHYFANLKIVDDHSRGNVSFLKAAARAVIKFLLGWYSFIVILATRRNQAVHDLLTRSTVQIRDPEKASPHQYITERTNSQGANMPSHWRRMAVICAYLLLVFFVLLSGLVAMLMMGFVSPRCLNGRICSKGEQILSTMISITWLVVMAMTIGMGWRGRLFGARKKSNPSD
jgi:uncharacterized RDD family membrane protein YckC